MEPANREKHESDMIRLVGAIAERCGQSKTKQGMFDCIELFDLESKMLDIAQEAYESLLIQLDIRIIPRMSQELVNSLFSEFAERAAELAIEGKINDAWVSVAAVTMTTKLWSVGEALAVEHARTRFTQYTSHTKAFSGIPVEMLRAATRMKIVSTWKAEPDACDICLFLNDNVIEFVADDGPPAHPNCILPGNKVVVPGRIEAATKSFYNGLAVELTFGSGGKITVTKNHPILTGYGWVAAEVLRVGDYVLGSRNAQRIATAINPDNNNVPAAVEDIFEAFRMSGEVSSVSVPSSPEDFHGDGQRIQGDIEIVYSNSSLVGDGVPKRRENVSQESFACGWGNGSLYGDGTLDKLAIGASSPSHGIVSCSNLSGPSFAGHPAPLNELGLGLVADNDAAFLKNSSHRLPPDASETGEFIYRFAGLIERDEVVGVREFNFSGHVYDLQVSPYELFFTGSIVTHNCRCWVEHAVEEAD